MKIAYRPEIDGLRAVAVVAVVAYHAGLVPAGFVGVDVFFVISGFLITRLLTEELRQTGRIDFLQFYARRARRILPAAVLVVGATLALAIALLPTGLAEVADSAAAASVFGANFYFQSVTGGYWSAAAETMPLLHLWSLSVEEQFYLLWPLFLLLVRRPFAWLVGVAIVSFALAEALSWTYPQAAFYQMPARAWELALGGIVAVRPLNLPRWAGVAGLGIVLVSCVVPLPHFPGVGALPAVVGSALLIAAIHAGQRVRVLEWRPIVFVGLVSYSFYLWHWPLLAIDRALRVGDAPLSMRLVLCTVAFALAAVSYRYVETPFRRMRWPKGRTVAIGTAISASLALAACGYSLHVRNAPANPERLDVAPTGCHAGKGEQATIKCRPTPESRVGIWGDSMAFAWSPLAWQLDPKAAAFTRDGCDPFVGYLQDNPLPADVRCRDFNRQAAVEAIKLDTVILAAWWPEDASLDALASTLDALRPVRRVVILGPSPHMRDAVPVCIRHHAEALCAIPRAQFDAESAPVLAKLRVLAATYSNVEVVDVADHFCTANTCPPVKEGVPLYWDTHHVTATVARSFVLPEHVTASR